MSDLTVERVSAHDDPRLADYRDLRDVTLLGSEGPGLTARWQRAADIRARIPMAAGIDSLNVAAATAVACYVLRP